MTMMASRPTALPRLDLGPESADHVCIRVIRRLHPGDLDAATAGRLLCPVHVHVGGFSGDVAAALHARELHRFGDELRAVRNGARRTAVLESSEGWVDLAVTQEADRTLSVVGYVADEPGTGSRLRFRLDGLAPAHLDAWIDACTAVDVTYPETRAS